MIKFELLNFETNSFKTEEQEGVQKIRFFVTLFVGIVGNTYPGFVNNQNGIEVVVDKSLTGDEMDDAIIAEATQFVNENYPPIP